MTTNALPVKMLRSMEYILVPCADCRGVGGSCLVCDGTGGLLARLPALNVGEPQAAGESKRAPAINPEPPQTWQGH